jgi:hypothetical protein
MLLDPGTLSDVPADATGSKPIEEIGGGLCSACSSLRCSMLSILEEPLPTWLGVLYENDMSAYMSSDVDVEAWVAATDAACATDSAEVTDFGGGCAENLQRFPEGRNDPNSVSFRDG